MDKDNQCPLNPNCPYLETIISLKNDVQWLKKLFNIRAVIDIATFISILGFLFTIWTLVK